MEKRINISYHAAKILLLELLKIKELSQDEDIKKRVHHYMKKNATDIPVNISVSRILIDKECRIFLSDYSKKEIHIPFLAKTVFLFFLIHQEGVEFRKMTQYQQELYNIYQMVSAKKNMEATKIKSCIANLCNTSSNRIYETCSIIRKAFKSVGEANSMHIYCISGKKGNLQGINVDRRLIRVEHPKLKALFGDMDLGN